MTYSAFLYLAVIFCLSYLVKIVTAKIRIPEVTGYVLLGVVIGISGFRFLDVGALNGLKSLSTIALGIIAFIIGSELRFDVIKKLGRSIGFIVILESMGAFLAVFLALRLIFPDSFFEALLLGAVASATAPAATVAVIRQYGAKGTLTTTILAVVGIDDAVSLIIYVFASSFVKAGLVGETVSVFRTLLSAFTSIGVSLLLGAGSSFLFLLILKKVKQNDLIQVLLTGFIFGMLAVCEVLKVSELLSIMIFATVLTNVNPVLSKKSSSIVESFSPIFLAAFFILGGAHLDFSLIGKIGLMGAAYFLFRSIGKVSGALAGAWIGKAPQVVKKYIGFSLLPQVGVALALALSIEKDFNVPKYGTQGSAMASAIINILLFTTIITEIVGPLLTKTALKKAGEVGKA
jgi:Kef-type K+ transport system membrane component KefB